MSRFDPFDIIYVKFPYGGKITKSPHPALILQTFQNSKGEDFAVVAAGTSAVHKDSLEVKHIKKDNQLLLSGQMVEESGLVFPTLFKFDPIKLIDNKMVDGSVMVISLDDTFLTKCPKGPSANKTKIGRLDTADCRIKDQIHNLKKTVNMNQLVEDHIDLYSRKGFDFLQQETDISVSTVKKNINDFRLNRYKEKNISKKIKF